MFPQKNVFPIDSEPSNRAQMLGDNRWLSQTPFPAAVDPPENIDWAALAQQWIHMKETCHTIAPAPPPLMPIAPPPPRLSAVPTRDMGEEQGEAPMEVEHDDEPPAPSLDNLTAPPPPTNLFGNSKNWANNQNEASSRPSKWNSSGKKQNRWNSTSNSSRSKRGNDYHGNQSRSVKVWDAPPPVIASVASASNEMRFNETDAKSGTTAASTPVGIEDGATLDASQRKKLPAWIREGLEKMEREKQRQVDRDREMKERDEKRRQEKLLEQNLLMQFNANEPTPLIPAKSKFESDSDSDSDSDDKLNSDKYTTSGGMSPASTTMAKATTPAATLSSTPTVSINQQRTKAEILTEIMLSVRKNLTEILLEVTSEEISAIAQDTLSKVRSKGRKPQIVQKIAKTANSTALGLVFYDDSDASRSDYDSDTDRRRGLNDSENDSELELKKTIQIRKQAFESKAGEIESYLAEKERKEKQWLEEDDIVEQPATSTGKTVVIATTAMSLQKPSSDNDMNKAAAIGSKTERKGSRFSDGKSLIYNVASSQLLLNPSVPAVKPQSTVPLAAPTDPRPTDLKRADAKRASSDEASSSSGKKSKKSSRHRSKRDRSRSHSRSKKRKRANKRSRRSSSSSSHSSAGGSSDTESRHKSHKHSRRRDRSSSDDRTSRSSYGSHKHDKYSREKSRSHSYRRSRSRSRDRHRRY